MKSRSDVIRSRDNVLVKRVARLAESARERATEGLGILEGCHLIRACLAAPRFGVVSLERIIVCETVIDLPEVRATLDAATGVPQSLMAEGPFARLGPVSGPNAVLGLMRLPVQPWPEPEPVRAFELWLEDVQDPGNVGTLIRTAAAAGVTAVRLSPGCADPWSPKVLRAGMGGQFVVSIEADADLERRSRIAPLTTHALALTASGDLYDEQLARPLALVLGNEGAGLSAGLLANVHRPMRIRMPGAVESLNVAAAGAVALFEVVRRERRLAPLGTQGV